MNFKDFGKALATGGLSVVTDELGITKDKYKKQDQAAKEAMDKAVAEYEKLNPPVIEEYNPDQYQWNGDLQLEGVDSGKGINYQDIDNAFGGVSTDPILREKQLASLGALDSIITGGGFNATDRANLNRVQSEAAQADRGRREAILQNMSARGMGGSGMELLAQLQSSQAATDRQSQAGLDIAGMAQQRALDAIMKQGALSGGVREQDFGEAAQKAQAANAIAQFNANNKMNVNQFNKQNELDVAKFNANTQNNANQANWQGKQNIADKNIELINQAQMQNKIINPQQNFQNQANIAQGKANAQVGMANDWQQNAAQKSAKDGQIINGIAGLGAAGLMASDKRVKKEIKSINPKDIEEFMLAVKPKSFKYKGSDEKKQGFIMQDILDTKIGKEIARQDNTGVLGFDPQSLQGVMLAAISELSKEKKDK